MSTRVTNMQPMTIGKLSRRTGVAVKALREYTDLGLIYTLGRSSAGYRLYDTDALGCVQFIGEMRALGLTIAEIHQLAATAENGEENRLLGSHLAQLLQRSRTRLRRRIAVYREMLARVEEFEAQHSAQLAAGDLSWTDRPTECRGAQQHSQIG